jgi:membrane-associated phospholipid phosphatase
VFGTYSAGWILLALAAFVVTGDRVCLVIAALNPVEFAATNGPVKLIFRRSRPPPFEQVELPGWVPRPVTSSFPSGHAAAGFFNAALWIWVSRPFGLLVLSLAAAVAASRVALRLHYLSDVIGGCVWGGIFGVVCIELARLAT